VEVPDPLEQRPTDWHKFLRAINAYDRLLASVGERASEIEPTPVVVHWPHSGSCYRGTVIVGQALRGWPDDFPATTFGTAEGRSRAIETARERNADRDDPMDWVATHRVRNSPFWKTARLVAEALEPDEDKPWFARWCWLNLYPCAPADPPGNPSGALKEAQDPFVGELLAAQIDLLEARRVIAFVGPWWWPAAGPAGLAELPEATAPLLRAGRDATGRTWVVGWHPNGASHRGWGPNRYAQLVVDMVRAIEDEAGEDGS
jgi:hypothetical protein